MDEEVCQCQGGHDLHRTLVDAGAKKLVDKDERPPQDGKIIKRVSSNLGLHVDADNLEPHLRTNDPGVLPKIGRTCCHQEGLPITFL